MLGRGSFAGEQMEQDKQAGGLRFGAVVRHYSTPVELGFVFVVNSFASKWKSTATLSNWLATEKKLLNCV